MAINDLLFPMVDKFGSEIIPDILRGFEESILLSKLQMNEFSNYLSMLEDLSNAGAEFPCRAFDSEVSDTRLYDRSSFIKNDSDQKALTVVPGIILNSSGGASYPDVEKNILVDFQHSSKSMHGGPLK